VEHRTALVDRHRRLESAIERPVRLDVVDAVPVADGEPREVGRAEFGGLGS
jgi:hypothetical protein